MEAFRSLSHGLEQGPIADSESETCLIVTLVRNLHFGC